MTIMAVEAAAPAAEAEGAEAGAAVGRKRAARYAREKAQSAAKNAPGYYAGQVRDAGSGQLIPGDRSYQPVILAEFLVSTLVVAFAPIARSSGGSGGRSGPSPYHVDDLVQLVAIGIFFFILALTSSGPKGGKLAAMLGGLVTLTLLITKNSSGDLSAIVTTLTASEADRQATQAASQHPANRPTPPRA